VSFARQRGARIAFERRDRRFPLGAAAVVAIFEPAIPRNVSRQSANANGIELSGYIAYSLPRSLETLPQGGNLGSCS
jgi:hypothetical protein